MTDWPRPHTQQLQKPAAFPAPNGDAKWGRRVTPPGRAELEAALSRKPVSRRRLQLLGRVADLVGEEHGHQHQHSSEDRDRGQYCLPNITNVPTAPGRPFVMAAQEQPVRLHRRLTTSESSRRRDRAPDGREPDPRAGRTQSPVRIRCGAPGGDARSAAASPDPLGAVAVRVLR